jgi:hypothetical protein
MSLYAGAYWRKLKQRLNPEGSEVVTNCHGLKLEASDGCISSRRHRYLDLTDAEGYTPRNTPYFQQLYAVTRHTAYGLNQDEVLT